MKRVLIFFSFIFVLLGAGVAAVPFLLDAKFVTEQLQTAVRDATGRTLTLSQSPRFTFWPEFSVEVEGASLSNPPGMYTGQLAKMQRLKARVAVMPLLSRKVEIKELTLVRPDLSLIVDGKGNANWTFAAAKRSGSSAGTGAGDLDVDQVVDSISIAPLQITGGRIRYLDERTGSVFSAKDVNVTVSLPDLDSPLTIKGSLVWKGEKVKLNAFIKAPQRLPAGGSPVDLALEARLLSLTFNGRAAMTNGISLAGNTDMKSSSLRDLAKWAGRPLAPGKGLGAFYAKGALDMSGNKIRLNKARFGLDGMNAQGNVSATLAGARPTITANLGVDRIDANFYAPPARSGTGERAVTAGWSDKPIDLSGLKALNAKLNLAAASIRYGDVNIGKTNVVANLANGVLKADLKKMTFYDGKAEGKLVLDGTRAKPTLQGALSANSLDGYRLLTDFAGIQRIEGVSGIRLSIAATGKSQRELVSTMRGTSKLQFNNGALRGLNIAQMIRNVQKTILGGWDTQENQKTDFSLFEATFDIKDGIAQNNDLKLIGPLVRVTGLGEVDLLRQRLDYKTTPKLVASLKGQGGKEDLTGIAVPIIIKGPWSNPKIYPDIEGILQNPEAAFKALARLGTELTGKDLEAKAEKLQKKAKKKVRKLKKKALKKVQKEVTEKAGKVLGEEAGALLGEDASRGLEQGGANLLNNLLGGGKKQQPAPAPAQ